MEIKSRWKQSRDCYRSGQNEVMKSMSGSPHHQRTRCGGDSFLTAAGLLWCIPRRPFPTALDFHGTATSKKGGLEISTNILWKMVNNSLWITDDSAIYRIDICADSDSATAEKSFEKCHQQIRSPPADKLRKMPLAETSWKLLESNFPTYRLSFWLGRRRPTTNQVTMATCGESVLN